MTERKAQYRKNGMFMGMYLLIAGIVLVGTGYAEARIGQELKMEINRDTLDGEIRGNFVLEEAEMGSYQVDFYIANERLEKLEWKETQEVALSVDGEGYKGEFDINVSNIELKGEFALYVAVLNDYGQKIGLGKEQVRLNTPPKEGGSEVLIGSSLEKKEKDRVRVKIQFKNNNKEKSLVPVATVYESGGRSYYGEYKGKESKVGAGEEREFDFTFPTPKTPERYVVILGVEDRDGKRYGGEFVETLVIEGEYGEILGVVPPTTTHLGDLKELEVSMRGIVSSPGSYKVELELVQEKEKAGEVERVMKSKDIEVGGDLGFSIEDSFSLDLKASIIKIKAVIRDTQASTILEEKEFEWSRSPRADVGKGKDGLSTKTMEKKVWESPTVLAGAGVALLILLFTLILGRKKKHLMLLLLVGSGLFINDTWGQEGVPVVTLMERYEGPFIMTPDVISTYTPDNTKDIGFRNVFVQGVIEDGTGTSIFEDYELETITAQVVNAEGGDIGDGATVEDEDVYFYREMVTVHGTNVWGYKLYVDITDMDLEEETYGIKLIFNFEGGESLEGVLNPYFKVDKTSPNLTFEVSDTTPNKDDKTISIICEDASDHCIDQPTAGTGDLDDTDKIFDAQVKGNFCDGVGDGGKLCRLDTTTNKYKTFEVCDEMGNCGDIVAAEDFFYYDPFPPTMGVIQLFKSAKEGNESIVEGDVTKEDEELEEFLEEQNPTGGVNKVGNLDSTLRIADIERVRVTINGKELDQAVDGSILSRATRTKDTKTGAPIAAHGRFGLDLLDDQDNTITTADTVEVGGQVFPVNDTWAQGPGGDPNGCGESEYDFVNGAPGVPMYIARDYGGKKGDFYFGASADETNINKCRQRMVSCSNSPGHRGFWDRSLDPLTSATTESCSFDGLPQNNCADLGGDCCGEGYVYNAETELCEEQMQCDPVEKSRILNENGGIYSVWMVDSGATKVSQDWTFEEGVPAITDPMDGAIEYDSDPCTWGCLNGVGPDGKCIPSSCFTDKFPFCFPVCLDGTTLNDNGTPSDETDDFCENSTTITSSCPEKQVFTYTNADQVLTVPENVSALKVKAWGGGGSGDGKPEWAYLGISTTDGAPGGYTEATLPVAGAGEYTVVVGQASSAYKAIRGFGGSGGADGGGGGLTGLFTGTEPVDANSRSRALVIAGGGGGSSGNPGCVGGQSGAGNAPDAGGQANMQGQGWGLNAMVEAYPGAGGGYSGGNAAHCNAGGGKGGSGYVHPSAIASSIEYSQSTDVNPPRTSDPDYQPNVGRTSFLNVELYTPCIVPGQECRGPNNGLMVVEFMCG